MIIIILKKQKKRKSQNKIFKKLLQALQQGMYDIYSYNSFSKFKNREYLYGLDSQKRLHNRRVIRNNELMIRRI